MGVKPPKYYMRVINILVLTFAVLSLTLYNNRCL